MSEGKKYQLVEILAGYCISSVRIDLSSEQLKKKKSLRTAISNIIKSTVHDWQKFLNFSKVKK